MDDETGMSIPQQKDFRQDFVYSMIKHGLLDFEAPARLLGVAATEDMTPLVQKDEIIEEANDIMDEEGAVQRLLQRMGTLDGNQAVIVAGILEVSAVFGGAGC